MRRQLRYLLASLAVHVILLAWFGQDIPRLEGGASRAATDGMRASLVAPRADDLRERSAAESLPRTERTERQVSVDAQSAAAPEIRSPNHGGVLEQPVSAPPLGQQNPEETPSPEAIGVYRLNLARASRMFREYPALARERNWQGVVVVVVTTVAGLGRPQVTLSQSSGHELLDTRALSMVDQAVGIAVLPDGLRGRQFALTLPIHFSLAASND